MYLETMTEFLNFVESQRRLSKKYSLEKCIITVNYLTIQKMTFAQSISVVLMVRVSSCICVIF